MNVASVKATWPDEPPLGEVVGQFERKSLGQLALGRHGLSVGWAHG